MPRKRKNISSSNDNSTVDDSTVEGSGESPAKRANTVRDALAVIADAALGPTNSAADGDVEMKPAAKGKDEKKITTQTKPESSAAASAAATPASAAAQTGIPAAPADAKVNYVNTSPQLSQLFEVLKTLGIILYSDFSNLTKERIEFWCQNKKDIPNINNFKDYLLSIITDRNLFSKLQAEFAARPKSLLVLDLDQTVHFVNPDPTINHVEWIGDRNSWPNIIFRLEQAVRARGGELQLAIATSKLYFSKKIAAAIKAFKYWLRKSNPHLLWDNPRFKKQFCLVNERGVLSYNDLDCQVAYDIVPENSFSNVYMTDPAKSSAIIAICNAFGIPIERCVLVDDTPEVRQEVEAQGIATVSTECFRILVPKFDRDGNERGVEIDKDKAADYKNKKKLEENLTRIEKEIHDKLIAMVQLALRPQATAASATAVAASMAAGVAPLIAASAAAAAVPAQQAPMTTALPAQQPPIAVAAPA